MVGSLMFGGLGAWALLDLPLPVLDAGDAARRPVALARLGAHAETCFGLAGDGRGSGIVAQSSSGRESGLARVRADSGVRR
ncbi:hypothetical protein [Nocardia wallacei]|nr:hypothetical protein [Nocardia wallacei]